MLRYLTAVLLAVCLSGCSTITSELKVPLDDGTYKIYEVISTRDGLVEFEWKDADKEAKFKVDNRGRPSMWESMFGIMLNNTELKNK